MLMVSTVWLFAETVEIRGIEVLLVPFVAITLFSLIFLIPFSLFGKWFFYRRRLKKQVITAEYEPPLGFNPAEIGYMFDGKLGEREIGATVIHLVQRGLLHIKRVNGEKRIFAGPRVDEHLKVYEKKIISEADIEEGATAQQLIDRYMSVSSGKMQVGMSRRIVFTQLVHSDLYRKQYVKGSYLKHFLFNAFKMYLLLCAVLIFIPFITVWFLLTLQNGAFDFLMLFSVVFGSFIFSWILFLPFFLSACALEYVRGRITGRQWIVTPKLARMWPQIVGFREYVKQVENERLEFYSEQLEEKTKNDLLPYAVALGFVKNWRNIIS